ncbi:MAG: CHASE3 domain-containing protein, partial [Burkholderiaceae bacterium]|nr:CHASE3 domain-containing protein [Burkholderiaceae bacterium]
MLTLPLAAIAAILVFWVTESAHRDSTASLESLGQRAIARSHIQTLWRVLVDAETGQRGYLLTGRREYLKPYEDAQGAIA